MSKPVAAMAAGVGKKLAYELTNCSIACCAVARASSCDCVLPATRRLIVPELIADSTNKVSRVSMIRLTTSAEPDCAAGRRGVLITPPPRGVVQAHDLGIRVPLVAGERVVGGVVHRDRPERVRLRV